MSDIRDFTKRIKTAWPMRLCDEINRKLRPHDMEHIKPIIIRTIVLIERKSNGRKEEEFETSNSIN